MTQGMTEIPDTWAAHLEPDETLIWTGNPIAAFRWHTHGWYASTLFVLRIALGLMIVHLLGFGIDQMASFNLILIALLYVGLGLSVLTLIAVWTWLQRRSARYALTSKRALVAEQFPYARLRDYPIYRDKPILEGRTSPKSLYFACHERALNFTSYRVSEGFEHLADFDTALKHATSVQEDAPWRPDGVLHRGLQWASAYGEMNTG